MDDITTINSVETVIEKNNESHNRINTIRIDDIKVNQRKRPVNFDKVKELAESMKATGLISPITTTSNHELIAGGHRIEAAKMLGWKEIEMKVLDVTGLKAELAEMDENFVRQELSGVEFGEFLIRRDEILKELGLRAKQGDNRFTNDRGAENAPLKETTADQAKKFGMSKRSLQQAKQLAKELTPEAKRAVSSHELSKEQALALAREERKMQNASIVQTFKEKDVKIILKSLETGKEKHSCLIVHYPEMLSCLKEKRKVKGNLYREYGSLIFVWTTWELLNEAMWFFHDIDYWNFDFERVIVWDTGSHCELCIVGSEHFSSSPDDLLNDLPYIFKEPEKKEGQKPEEFYNLIDKLFVDKKIIEFFPKEKREGYTTFEMEKIHITIPDDMLYNIIGKHSCEGERINSVTIPNCVTVIEERAFANNLLADVTIPDSVVLIQDEAFSENILTNVVIGNGVTTIGAKAFANNHLTSITIPDSVTEIKAGAFANNNLTSVIFGKNVRKIGENAFANNHLDSITIPDSITEIADYAFANNTPTSITTPDKFFSIGEFAFNFDKLEPHARKQLRGALERFFTIHTEKYSKMICPLYFTPGANTSLAEDKAKESGYDYLYFNGAIYIDACEIDISKCGNTEFKSWKETPLGKYVYGNGLLDGSRYKEDFGYLTKEGFVWAHVFKRMKPKPEKLTVAEYREFLKAENKL
jgi:ParB-like chromosome segregation protein Spo0J